MALPGISEVISDGNLNLVAGNAENAIVKIGVCTSGSPAVLQAFGTQNSMTSALGLGSLSENLAYQLAVAGGPVIALPVEPSSAGSIGSVTHVGSGTGALSISAAPHQSVLIEITSTGALGTGKYKVSLNGDGYSAEQVLPVGGTARILGSYMVASFTAGTYHSGDGYTFAVDGTASGSGGGGSPSISQASSPIDNYDVVVTITKSGAAGTAQATYSLDGGTSVSPPFITSSAYVVPNAGLVLDFSGDFTLGDTYSFQTCGPSFSNTDLAAAFAALETTYLASQYSMISVVQGGSLASAAAAETQASALEVDCDALFNLGVNVRAIAECPTVGSVATVSGNLVVDSADTDTVVETAFQSLSAARVAVCAGDCRLFGPLSGLTLRRNASWVVSARLASIGAATDAGWVQLGGVPGVSLLYRDEFQTQGLNDARFTTLRTIVGDPGFFITTCKTMASLGSDYAYMTNARVIDKAATIARQWATPLINSKVPITQNPAAVQGSISAGAAQKLDNSLTSVLTAELVNTSPQDAVAARGTVDTNHNVLADGVLPITVAVVPFAYAREIIITLGFAVAV